MVYLVFPRTCRQDSLLDRATACSLFFGFSRGSTMFKASPIRPYIELLSSYLKPLRSRMWALAVLLLGAIGLQFAGPQAVRYFIDTAQTGGDLSALYAAAALFLVFNLASRALGALTTYIGNDVAWRATNSMRSDLLLHILNLDMSFHTEHTHGELVERVDGDVGLRWLLRGKGDVESSKEPFQGHHVQPPASRRSESG